MDPEIRGQADIGTPFIKWRIAGLYPSLQLHAQVVAKYWGQGFGECIQKYGFKVSQ